MKVDQVIRLLEAGYSKEEIQQMEAGNQETTKQEPAAEPKEPETEPAAAEQDPASKPEPETKPAAETAPDPETGKRLDGIENQLKQLIKTMQANNVRRDSYGSAGEDIEKQADKALAALIQPHETE